MPLSGSRTEFLQQTDAPSDIKYGRSGGWFVSSKKALGLLLMVVAALVLVGLLVYYLAPCRKDKTAQPIVSSPAGQSTPSIGTSSVVDSSVNSTTVAPPESPGTTLAPQTNVRLSRNVKPYYYNVRLQPFIGENDSNFTFKGRVSILLSCQNGDQKCESITLHSKQLHIMWDEVTLTTVMEGTEPNGTQTKKGLPKKFPGNTTKSDGNTTKSDDVALSTVDDVGGSMLKIIAKSEDPGNETITIQMDPVLEPGMNYTLQIPFWGNITYGLRGLYRSVYTDENGVKKSLAVTHMEATHARRVFPCFDEPAMKAQFEIHVLRKDNLTSVSNMPLVSSQLVPDQPGWVVDSFEPTPVMSTYLVAVLVSDFGALNSTGIDPKFSVLARKGQLKNADYALSIGPQILNYYAEYFGIKYPLPKLDMVAIPDFAAGAMENWGLITYRENRLLYDNTSSPGTKQSIAATIAHELAHMWFGNLVTMDWWADLWLNEGFATYVAKIGTDHVEPSWETLDQIIVKDVSYGMEIDSLHSTHAIYVPVSTPAQISEVFDSVSYNKGACLIRMLNHSLTETVFKTGVRDYLNTWMYANANEDDLWTALTAATTNQTGLLPAGAGVKEVMDSWTRQEGFPVVTVTRDYNDGSMMLSQQRFTLSNTTDKAAAERWYIPVSYTNQEEMRVYETRPRVWLDVKSDRRVEGVTKPGSDNWVLVNLQQTGFYRVNYDDTNWRLITNYLKTAPVENIPTATRAQLVGDAFNLARAGLLNYGKALNLSLYLSRERRYVPLQAFLKGIYYLDLMLRETVAYGNLVRYMETLLTPVETLLGMEVQPNDTHTQRLLRRAIMQHMLDAEVPRHVDNALNLYRRWLNSNTTNPIPSDFRMNVYCAGIRSGTVRDWNQMWSRFEAEDDPVERQYLLSSLTCTRNTYLITTLLEKTVEKDSSFRLQDFRSVWQALDDNPIAVNVAFRYVRQNWKDIFSRYDGLDFILKSVISGVTSGLSTEMDLKNLLEFQEAHKETFTSITRTMAQAIEKVQLRVLWRQKHEATVSEWLAQHVKTLA
ncbi:aminopeptidase N [Anabrus simplex]|uniref:aminopeptidase N n=1 Tax=Anabrus simplex TaxID=316456 RepID=UPI0035A31239